MATYKVLQDIEAEDTLIGPLTLRQCIYAAIAAVCGYLSFICISKGAPWLVLFLLPFIGLGVFFAFPWRKQQSTEVWALAKVRFIVKPRKRIWDQSGAKQLVTITVPRSIKNTYTSSLTPGEVQSRLKALADTIDSRGWAIKNVDLGYYTKPTVLQAGDSDRLVDASSLPQEVPGYDTTTTSDIFDVQNNPIAQKFDAMMTQSADAHRQQIVDQLAATQPAAGGSTLPAPTAPIANYWHIRTISPLTAGQATTQPQPPTAVQPAGQIPLANPTGAGTAQPPAGPPQSNDSILAQGVQALGMPVPADYSNLRTPVPMPVPPVGVTTVANPAQPAVTAPPNPAILELANNNDLNVATIAREAQARNEEPPDEVIVSLH